MPVTARRQAIKFKVLICAASFALIPQNQRHPCSCCCCPQLVSSCHICSRCHATRSLSPDVHRMDVLSNREQRLSYKGESSVLRVSLLPASQQPARASTFVSAISSQQLSALAPAMLAATRASNSRAKSAPATCVPTQRSNSRANVSPAIRVPTQRQQLACQLSAAIPVPTCRQQFACQLSASNSRANFGVAIRVPLRANDNSASLRYVQCRPPALPARAPPCSFCSGTVHVMAPFRPSPSLGLHSVSGYRDVRP